MRTFSHFVLLLTGCWLFPQPAAGQSRLLYQDVFIPPSTTLQVGIDDGSGFVLSMMTDDDADGVIQLPTVPSGYRVALGFPETAHEDCLIYTTIGTDVYAGHTFDLPLFGRVGGGPFGANITDLRRPLTMLQPHDTFTSLNGIFPGWPGVRWLDTTGVPNFPTFAQQVDTLPGFTGGIEITESFIRFRVVPEPSVWFCLVPGLLTIWGIRRYQRRPETPSACSRGNSSI